MGVFLWTRFLYEDGWMPASQCCSTSLWCDHGLERNSSSSRFIPVTALPVDSELHMDGYSICFHIWQVAYARHIQNVTGKSTCCLSVKQASRLHLQRILPSFVPLSVIASVTREFVDSIRAHGMKLSLYWDGDERVHFKQSTDTSRIDDADDEWATYHDYCETGCLPRKNAKLCEMRWPKSRCFAACVLQALENVSMVFCTEEADAAIAKAVSGKPNAFIVAWDSDFCFFKDCNYIPLPTLGLTDDRSVCGTVLRRDKFASELDLPEELMVEAALLLGNDYVSRKDTMSPLSKSKSVTVEAVLSFLRAKDESYRVVGHDKAAISFVRHLYDLQDTSKTKRYTHDDLVESNPENSLRPKLPDSVNLELLTLDEEAPSMKAAVLRCLRNYIAQDLSDAPVLNLAHIELFEVFQLKAYGQSSKTLWRPTWSSVNVVTMIERLLKECIWINRNDSIMREVELSLLWDPYHFHWELQRANGTKDVEATTSSSKEAVESEQDSVGPTSRPVLPVDEFQDIILESVKRQRVTIIQGETGCGKSSRIPIMLLDAPPPDPFMKKSKMFISVPRRIAAKALVERLRAVEPEFRDEIALRMGHGVKEYESPCTRAWFVTTGYLVRLLANHPERFNGLSHLIIDEIHERSVDTDILCLLCRRLLHTNHSIRLVLMSATLAASMYQDYFGVPEPPIKVGAKRFPVEEVFLEDLSLKLKLPKHLVKKRANLEDDCRKMRCDQAPSTSYMEKLYSLVAYVASAVGKPGSSVLIFVPGMNDIISLTEAIEEIHAPEYIPFEDQMHVFDVAQPDEVRIVIATNAAESSITLPEVDSVICLGLCKHIVYNKASHRQLLTPAWISRASATQRAGRTGRLRPGTVYRMYTKENFHDHMLDFEPGEILRTPLDSVILMLKEMLSDEHATEVLSSCIEPPDTTAIEASFKSLHELHFITSPDDYGAISELGLFACALGLDLALCSLIGLAIQFGVGAEAIQMAAVLSFPQTPWIMSNPLIHGPKSFNETIATTFASKCHFDAQLFSDQFGKMNLLHEFGRTHPSNRLKWCTRNGIFLPRIRHLESTYINLRHRVAQYLHLQDDQLVFSKPPSQLSNGQITVLRAIQVWVFHETVIEFDPSVLKKNGSNGTHTIPLGSTKDRLKASHVDTLLEKFKRSYRLVSYSEVKQTGTFSPTNIPSETGFCESLEPRCISYCTEKSYALSVVSLPVSVSMYVTLELFNCHAFQAVKNMFEPDVKPRRLIARLQDSVKTRGLLERSCGRWSIEEAAMDKEPLTRSEDLVWCKLVQSFNKPSKRMFFENQLRKQVNLFSSANSTRVLNFSFPWKLDIGNKLQYTIVATWEEKAISNLDLTDLFGTPNIKGSSDVKRGDQNIVFDMETKVGYATSKKPLVECIPEGARLLSVLASSRRREHVILFPDFGSDEKGAISKVDDGEEKALEVKLPANTNLANRWKRFGTNKAVYVEVNSVPASAVPTNQSKVLYCCAANTLEVRGGGMRADGLTMLPAGRLFLLLCRFSMGLFNRSHVEDGSIYEIAISWIGEPATKSEKKDITARIKKAIELHESSLILQEQLQCFPDKVRELLSIFDGIDGEDVEWEGLGNDPFILLLEKNVSSRSYTKSPMQARKDAIETVASDGPKTHLNKNTNEKASGGVSKRKKMTKAEKNKATKKKQGKTKKPSKK